MTTTTKPTYDQLYLENLRLKSELDNFRRLVFGQKRERFVPTTDHRQLSCITNAECKPSKLEIEKITYERKKSHKKQPPHGRNKLLGHLKRYRIIIEPDEDVSGLKKIGEEITEELEYKPGKLYVNQYVRPKYAKPQDEGVIIAELPSRPTEKGIAGPRLLSHILISKYVDHLPLYRQRQQFKRQGVGIASSTMDGWVKAAGALLVPLYHLQKE